MSVFLIIQITQIIVITVFVAAAIVAATHWAVKHGHLTPFGVLPRAVRRASEPVLRPLERRMLRSGGNPVNAPYMLFLVALIGGLALLALVRWTIGIVAGLVSSAAAGPRGLLVFAVDGTISVLMLALLIRVVTSWFAVSPYSKPMRVVHGLTDWMIEPLRKVVPPLGVVDITPLVAYFILYLVRALVLGWM